MGARVFASPQYKITCKHISPKVNIESVDKKFVNEYKKLLDKYELIVVPIAFYNGAVDEQGYAEDVDDYDEWKNSHPDVISKKSINNLFRKIKNKSRLEYNMNGNVEGTVFGVGFVDGNYFELPILITTVLQAVLSFTKFTIIYDNGTVITDTIQKDIFT